MGRELENWGRRDPEKPYGPSALLLNHQKNGKPGELLLEDAELVFRTNFAGNPTQFQPEGGKRTFNVKIYPEIAEDMIADGWNVRQLKPQPDGTPGDYIIEIEVKYRARDGRELTPPMIALQNSEGRVLLNEETIHFLDQIEYERLDVIVRPYFHEMSGGGIKAYLKTLFVRQREDYLMMKYGGETVLDGGNTPALESSPMDIVEGVIVE